MAAFREEWPCLLVVPSSLREAWADALVEWLGVTERDMLIVAAARDLEALRERRPGSGSGLGFSFVIISYALIGKLAAVLAGDAPDSGSGGSGSGGRRGGGRSGGGGRGGGGRRGRPAPPSVFGMVVCDESPYLKDFKVPPAGMTVRTCVPHDGRVQGAR